MPKPKLHFRFTKKLPKRVLCLNIINIYICHCTCGCMFVCRKYFANLGFPSLELCKVSKWSPRPQRYAGSFQPNHLFVEKSIILLWYWTRIELQILFKPCKRLCAIYWIGFVWLKKVPWILMGLEDQLWKNLILELQQQYLLLLIMKRIKHGKTRRGKSGWSLLWARVLW